MYNGAMRMQPCPHCGAENSIKRTKCYHCQRELSAPGGELEDAPPVADSRWSALEMSRRARQRPLRPFGGAVSTPAARVPAAARKRAAVGRPRGWVPARRRSLAYVRRMSAFYRQLQSLSRSGFPIAQACREMERNAPAPLRRVAREMRTEAEAGKPVSGVLERHRELVYPWHIGLIRAAEAAGTLPEAFDQIAHAYEVEWETRTALLWRLTVYAFFGIPMILLSLPGILLITQPIPKDGWTIPTIIQTLKHLLLTVSLPIGGGLVVLLVGWQILGAMPWFLAWQQRMVVRIPVIGALSRATALERYLGTFGLLLQAGVPIADSAELAALAAGNASLTPRLLQVVGELREGVPLTQALIATGALDEDTLNLMATGEMSGSLPEMLSRSATVLRQETDQKRRMALRMAGIALGVLWLVLAGGLVLFAVRAYFDFIFRAVEWFEIGL